MLSGHFVVLQVLLRHAPEQCVAMCKVFLMGVVACFVASAVDLMLCFLGQRLLMTGCLRAF